MKRPIVLTACLLHLWAGAASAQVGVSFFPGPGSPASSGFVGPCDVSGVTCVAYFSAGACATAAYSGNVADIVDSSTGTTTGTRLQCSNGVVSALVSASACTFVTGNACSSLATTCATACTYSSAVGGGGGVYNQMGTGTFPNMTANVVANRIPLSTSVLNSKPCFTGAGITKLIEGGGTATLAVPYTLITVANQPTASATAARFFANLAVTITFGFRSSGVVGSQGGTITQTATPGFHAFMEINGSGAGASSVVVDGVAGTAGTLALGWSADTLILMNDGGAANGLIGSGCEFIITSNALNPTAYAALNSNIRLANRWGNSF